MPKIVKTEKDVEGFYAINSTQEASYKVSRRKHEKKDYIVVPVIMMVEGVLNGSHGPLLHTTSDFGKFPEAWNGIPVVIDHPERDGAHVSANSPDVLEEYSVGKVFNTHVDGSRLRAEAWIDPEKLKEVHADLLGQITKAEMIEVSVGVFTEDEAVEGDWKGKTYSAIARNHRPDHLALLPYAIGACSIADGCGIRANKNPLNANADGYTAMLEQVNGLLKGLETDKMQCFLEELFEDHIIYRYVGHKENKMYLQMYEMKDTRITFVDPPVEVRKVVTYIPIGETENNVLDISKRPEYADLLSGGKDDRDADEADEETLSVNEVEGSPHFIRTRFINSNINLKEDVKMSKNECPECVEKVNALIANKESGFVEDDREWLSTLSAQALEKVTPKVIEVEKIVEKTIEVNKLAPEDQAALAFGKKQMKEMRERLVSGIQTNTSKEMWSDEKLATMDDDTLERLFNSVKKEEVVDYSLNGNAGSISHTGESPMAPTGIEFINK